MELVLYEHTHAITTGQKGECSAGCGAWLLINRVLLSSELFDNIVHVMRKEMNVDNECR